MLKASDTKFRIGDDRLARWTEWQGRLRTRDLGAIVVSDERPMLFVAGEVLVGRNDRELIEECLSRGGELVPATTLLPAPPELLRTRRVESAIFPMPVRIRFPEPLRDERPEAVLTERLFKIRGRYPRDAGIRISDDKAASLASFVARHASQGRSIILNSVGEPCALTLSAPTESSNATEGADPTAWAAFQSPVRMVEAWHLVESVRAIREIESVVWVAILDCGFWMDAAGAPLVGSGETASDFGLGVPSINLMSGGNNAGGSNSIPGVDGSAEPWHGNDSASVAVATVGNGIGAAGSGGTVARPFFFKSDLSMDQTIDCLRYCTAWGLDVVNMSFMNTITPVLFWDGVPNGYDEAFSFARDNGVIVVAAAGNNGASLPELNGRPATRTPGVITVGALDTNFGARPDSNFGSSVGIWAPGTSLPVVPNESSTLPISGTSAAAPFVAGVVAVMRAVNPSLNTGQVADILWRTGWNGTPGGRVTKGLDAYAAVLDALGGTLPSDFGEPNGTRQTAAQLFPTAGAPGVLAPPMGGKATHNLGDTDYWKFDLADISSVNVRVEWYWRLGGLTLLLEAEDPENASVDDMVTASGTSGVITMTGTLGPGRYFLRVAGTAVTAYELSVSVSKAILAKDQFEPNDSFETAKRLEFDSLAHFWEVAVWGPGDYDATLHRQRVPAGVNRDFFELHVPMATDDRISRVSIYHTDRPVDVALFDSSRTLIQNWADVRSVSIDPPAPSTCFLRISAKKPTRYKLGVARWVDPAVLPHQVDQAKVLPDWWKNPRFTLKDGVNYFAVDLEELRERRIAFTPTQEAIKLDLLDMEGHVVRQGSRDALGRLTVETGDLRQGRYLLSLARVEDAKRTAAIALQVAPPQPW